MDFQWLLVRIHSIKINYLLNYVADFLLCASVDFNQYKKSVHHYMTTKHPFLDTPTYIQQSKQQLQIVYKQNQISHQNEIDKLQIETILKLLFNNDSRLIIIQTFNK